MGNTLVWPANIINIQYIPYTSKYVTLTITEFLKFTEYTEYLVVSTEYLNLAEKYLFDCVFVVPV